MVEQNLEDRQLPIYIPISEYAKVFIITQDIYSLQINRLNIVQRNLGGLLNRDSEEEFEFVKIIFNHLSKLVIGKRIKKEPKKLVGEMPVCFFECEETGLNSWYGDENEAGSSICAGLDHFSDEVIFTGSQKVIQSLLPEAGIEIFDEPGLFEKLFRLREEGFSKHIHQTTDHSLNQECQDRNCLLGIHFLPTIVPVVVLSVEVSKVKNAPKIKEIAIVFARSEYQAN